MDLISCRNMLIYFDEYLHTKVVPTLHYALKLGGFLVLGQSESIGKFTNLFEPVKKDVYIRKKESSTRHYFWFASFTAISTKDEGS